jgi:hypothetical protein
MAFSNSKRTWCLSRDKTKDTARLVCLFSLLLLTIPNLKAQSSGKFKLGWHPNIETYFIAERLAVQTIGSYVFDNKTFDYSHQPMVTASFNYFKTYKDSAIIHRIAAILASLRSSFGDNLPIIDYLLYQKSFPEKGELYPYHFNNDYIPKKKQLILSELHELTDSLLSFYHKAKVGTFLKQNERFYNGAIAEVKKDVNKGIYAAMEKYFGQKFKGYYILITPTMPLTAGEDNYRGMGVSLNTGKGIIACMIMSTNIMLGSKPDINQYTTFGYDNPRITHFLTVHEMVHSFVNPPLDKYNDLIYRDSLLYTPALAELMRPQGIPNWKICVTEHFVRLGEIRIAEAMKDSKQANTLRRMHTDTFHFILLPMLEKKVKEYENRRKDYPHFKDFVPVLLNEIHMLQPRDIDSLLKGKKKDKPYQIITSDIDKFWAAYDSLRFAHSKEDSLKIIQSDYIEKGSEGLVEFLKVRPYTAKDYINSIATLPKFWRSLRSRTEQVKNQRKAIEKIYDTYTKYLPDFEPPNVCFAIGALRSGGTTTRNWIFIGTEMAAADSLIDTTELTGWLGQILGKGNGMANIISTIAHETVHTQQAEPKEETLLGLTITEGAADFIPEILLGVTNSNLIHTYGRQHECELWQQFQRDMKNNASYTNWLYGGSVVKGKPADLGYFLGAQICSAYYNRTKNKKKALTDILKNTDYALLLKDSHYNGNCSH